LGLHQLKRHNFHIITLAAKTIAINTVQSSLQVRILKVIALTGNLLQDYPYGEIEMSFQPAKIEYSQTTTGKWRHEN
jgi:hypothetical protein